MESRDTLEILEFRKGKFLLKEVSTPKLRLKLSRNSHWKALDDDSYETESLGAAAVFRHCADKNTRDLLTRAFQSHYTIPKLPPLLGLDPHQMEGLKWILSRKRSYLAHAPGAGKTAMAIFGAVFAEGPGQSVFVVPPTLTLNWVREIMKFTEWVGLWPTIGVVRTSDRQDEVAWRADFLIVPDSMLTKDWVYTRLLSTKKKFIAVDEASRFKDPLAERSLAFYGGISHGKKYRGLFQYVRHVVFLDGSPMPNRPMELWAPAYALHPESIDCRNYDDFGYRYCGARPNFRGQWEFKYSSNEEELKEKLQKDFMHVVTEDQLSHPERQRSMVFMNEDVRSIKHRAWESKHLSDPLMWSRLDESASQGELAKYRRELGVRKVPWVVKYVAGRLEEKNESILLFAWHRDVVAQLAADLSKFSLGVINGGVDAIKREKIISEFQEGKRKLLIMNIAAGGRGHNLQKADRVIFAEWSWTNETNKQCEKRASRKGSDKEFVRCEYLVCPNSMDEVVLNSVFTKEKRVEKIIG